MKFLKKAIAFLAVFLTVFGNGFFAMPVALAATNNLDNPNGTDWDIFSDWGIGSQYIGKYDENEDHFPYTIQSGDKFYHSGSGTTYNALGKPPITYVIVKAASGKGGSGGGLFAYSIPTGGGTGTLFATTAGATGTYNISVSYNESGYPRISASSGSDSHAISHAYFCVGGPNFGVIKVIKQDKADSSIKLEGAEFKVSKSETDFTAPNLVATLTTGSNGEAVSGNILCGTYWIKETVAPGGYVNDNATAKQITILKSSSPTTANTFTFEDRKNEGSLVVEKRNSLDDALVSGASFRIVGNGVDGTFVTGSGSYPAGKIVIDHLTPGDSYTVTETAAPAGYLINRAAGVSKTIPVGGSAVFTFEDDPWQKVRIIKRDGADESLLNGAVFGIFTNGECTGTPIATLTTGSESAGKALSAELRYDGATSYWVKEISAPAKYIADSTIQPVLFTGPGQIVEFTFFNERNFGGLTIEKVLQGSQNNTTEFEFTITGPGYPDGHTFLLAGGNSKSFPDLLFGTYTITETGKAGYKLIGFTGGDGTQNGSSYVVDLHVENQGITVTATNRELGQLKVTKMNDAQTLLLEGAVFQVSTSETDFTGGNLVATLTTGADGTDTSGWLDPGTYYIKETVAPTGYHNDNATPRAVTVIAGQTTANATTLFTDRPDVGSLLVQKYSSLDRSPVAGVTFQLLTMLPGDSEYTVVDTKITGANGQALFSGLPTGNVYWVRESQQAPGYDIDKDLVMGPYTIGFNQQALAEFVNNPVGQVSLLKYDEATIIGDNFENATKLAGAVYGVYGNAEATGSPVATITTSATGAVLSAELPFGGDHPATYYIKEITPPAGYQLSTLVKSVTFTEPGQVLPVYFTNVLSTGSLLIKKVDALNAELTLAGAVFELYADEALTTQVGAAVTTGADGLARFDNLAPGTYWLMETAAPVDYELLTVPLPVTVTAGVTNPDPIVITNQYNPPEDIVTGMMDWNILLLGLMGLAGGLMLAIRFGKRKEVKTR